MVGAEEPSGTSLEGARPVRTQYIFTVESRRMLRDSVAASQHQRRLLQRWLSLALGETDNLEIIALQQLFLQLRRRHRRVG